MRDSIKMMPGRNIELKARCTDLSAAARQAQSLGATRLGELVQTDTYFHAHHGRLKLREIQGQAAELIWYDRPDAVEFRGSDYHVVPVTDAAGMKAALAQALGVRIEVRKRRELWMWHNVRIHLDRVEGLGTFLEFEAVIAGDADERVSRQRLATLCAALEVRHDHRIDVSYSDLMLKTKPPH